MDVFGVEKGARKLIKINEENYELYTHYRKPFVQKRNDHVKHFALCPLCDNPIEIVGLYRREADANNPYGRHYKQSIYDLAKYNEEDYFNCPFSNPQDTKGKKRLPKSKYTIELIEIMREKFDRIVYFWNQNLPIFMSESLAKKCLREWINDEHYRNYGIRKTNLVYSLPHSGSNIRLNGRLVKSDSSLAGLLSTYPEVSLEPCSRDNYLKINANTSLMGKLYFHISDLASTTTDNKLYETATLNVWIGDEDKPHNIKVSIDAQHFLNILDMKNWHNNERNERLLAIARDLLPDTHDAET